MTFEHLQKHGSTPPPAGGGSGSAPAQRLGGVRNSETVINLERRAAALESLPELPAPSSAICGVLFPNPENIQNTLPNPFGVELGHFRIQSAIRSGGMGAVFEALDTRLNRTVALKILPPSLSRDTSSVLRFNNEAQAAAQLDHENIARVFFIGEDKGLHFIAFEFIKGTNLREIVQQRGKLTPSEAVNYTLQVASAVAHASAHGVVHRDIKPSNIIITPAGRAKLVDLGLARSEHRENLPDLTVAGTTLGTFDYISPEQARDPRAVDVRSDIYSLGCTLYHLLTGEPPYPQGTVLQKLLDHQGKDAPDPRLKNRKVTPELAAIVKMMMASDPRRRYQTAADLIRDLLVVAGSLGLRSVSPEGLMWLTAHNSSETFWERHASWLATAVGLLLIVGYLHFGWPQRDRDNLAQVRDPFAVDNQSGLREPDARGADSGQTSASDGSPPLISGGTGQSPLLAGQDSLESPAAVATAKPTFDSENSEPEGSAIKAIPRVITPGSLIDPRSVFNDPSEQGEFAPLPLVVNKPQGVMHGPREFQSDLLAANSPSSTAPKPASGNPDEQEAGPPSANPNSNGVKPGEKPTVGTSEPPAVAVVTPAGSDNKSSGDVAPQSSIVVIKSDGPSEQSFPTLEAACAVAQDGNIIELRFNGLRTESPIRIRNKLTIRGGKNFRPVIEFVPKEIPAAGYETRMMTISGGGTLDLVDVSLVLNVKGAIAADAWALISTQRADAVRVQRVLITVNNTPRRPTAVIEFRGGTSRMMADVEMMTSGQMSTPLTVRLADCMIRGGTDLFHVKSLLTARIDLDNCVLALDGAILRAQGSVDVPEKQTELSLRMNQLTAVLNSGLIAMEGGEVPRKLGRVSVEASNNIFTTLPAADQPPPPFVLMVSSDPQDDLLKLLDWNGQKNFYNGFQSYWTRSLTDGSKTTAWDFEEWKFRWDSKEVDPHTATVMEKKALAGRALSEVIPSDFSLDETLVANPAISAANNGGNAGADLSRLEKLHVALPPETAAVTEAPK